MTGRETDPHDTEIGRRFKPAGKTIFGRAKPTVLEVCKVEAGPGKIRHARLVNIFDHTDTRMIAWPALLDSRLFVEVKTEAH